MRRSAKEQTLTWMNTKWHAVVLPIRADDIQSDLSPAQLIMLSWAVAGQEATISTGTTLSTKLAAINCRSSTDV